MPGAIKSTLFLRAYVSKYLKIASALSPALAAGKFNLGVLELMFETMFEFCNVVTTSYGVLIDPLLTIRSAKPGLDTPLGEYEVTVRAPARRFCFENSFRDASP